MGQTWTQLQTLDDDYHGSKHLPAHSVMMGQWLSKMAKLGILEYITMIEAKKSRNCGANNTLVIPTEKLVGGLEHFFSSIYWK